MTINELLAERNLTSALIVDDAYDAVPRAEDLVANEDGWSNFFADIGDDVKHLRAAFPAFDRMDATELRNSDEFVAAVWGIRDKLRPELPTQLFDTYEQGTRSDRGFLNRLEAALKPLGVTPIRAGRTLPEGARDAGIVFADLFLGAAQIDPDMERSLARLMELLRGRERNPPLIILMSRSNLLQDKKTYFRDSASLLGAMFRVYSKQELLSGSTLERTLERLARHHSDALKVAAFTYAWDQGLKAAADRFLKDVRRLDLHDYAQIREVLLNFEGQPLGSYMLDVFDRVLQHEIEGDTATIDAAEALNEIDTERYPPPYIAGSPDLQTLMYRSIWQNPKRLSVKASESGIPVSFGDVLVRRDILNPEVQGLSSIDEMPGALVVLTPACDLMRDGNVNRILLMSGTLADLTHKTWTYKSAPLKTPIVVLPTTSGRRMWIRWKVKDVRTQLGSEISMMLTTDVGAYAIALRLRESHAIELQQRLLADMGRVGVPAQMPATFSVSLKGFTVGINGKLAPLALPKTERDGGVCYTGRDADGNENTRLVLTEGAVDELLDAILNIDENDIHIHARATLREGKASKMLGLALEVGLQAPNANRQAPLPIKVLTDPQSDEPATSVVGLLIRNPQAFDPATYDLQKELKHGAIVLVLMDL
jgi:hypothetical protein